MFHNVGCQAIQTDRPIVLWFNFISLFKIGFIHCSFHNGGTFPVSSDKLNMWLFQLEYMGLSLGNNYTIINCLLVYKIITGVSETLLFCCLMSYCKKNTGLIIGRQLQMLSHCELQSNTNARGVHLRLSWIIMNEHIDDCNEYFHFICYKDYNMSFIKHPLTFMATLPFIPHFAQFCIKISNNMHLYYIW